MVSCPRDTIVTYTNLQNMFATQPLLTCCLFGLPAGIFAIICYSMCSADFSVEHDEIYPDSEEDPSGQFYLEKTCLFETFFGFCIKIIILNFQKTTAITKNENDILDDVTCLSFVTFHNVLHIHFCM